MVRAVSFGNHSRAKSVPASRVAEVEAALTFLEAKRQQRGSQVVIELNRLGGAAQ